MEVPVSQEESEKQKREADEVGQVANQLLALQAGGNAGGVNMPQPQQQPPHGGQSANPVLPFDLSRPPPGYTHFASQPPTQPPQAGIGGGNKPFHDLPPFASASRSNSNGRLRGGPGGMGSSGVNNHWEGSSNHSSGSWNSGGRDNAMSGGGRPPRGIHGQSNDTPVGRLRRPLHAASNSSNQWSNGMSGRQPDVSNGVSRGGSHWNNDHTHVPSYGGGHMGGNSMGGRRGDYGGMSSDRGGGGNSWNNSDSHHSSGGGMTGNWSSDDRGGHRRGGGGGGFGGGGRGGGSSMNSGDSSTDWGTFDASAAMRSGGGKTWGADNNSDGHNSASAGGGWGDGAPWSCGGSI